MGGHLREEVKTGDKKKRKENAKTWE